MGVLSVTEFSAAIAPSWNHHYGTLYTNSYFSAIFCARCMKFSMVVDLDNTYRGRMMIMMIMMLMMMMTMMMMMMTEGR